MRYLKATEQSLKRRLDDKDDEKRRIKERTAYALDRESAMRQAQPRALMPFYCSRCRKDFTAMARKVVRSRYSLAWYAAACPIGHMSIRYITDKVLDPYYRLSPSAEAERRDHADDLLQPSDPRFREVYPEAWKRLK